MNKERSVVLRNLNKAFLFSKGLDGAPGENGKDGTKGSNVSMQIFLKICKINLPSNTNRKKTAFKCPVYFYAQFCFVTLS